ncbi:MAG: chemotaxis protein CheW [Rubrivivax sp.]|nr:MAG: chemotaxis protein CheW [Rubrivivax sp.]
MSLVTAAATPAAHPPSVALQRPEPAAVSREVLTFRIGAEEYAIDILRVQEIRSYSPLTRIAHASAAVKGVVNLRGVIVPVVDLRVCLQALSPTRDEDTVTIILDLGERIVGAVVDAVSDVLTLQSADIRRAPEMGRHATADALLGIACVGADEARRMLMLVDIEQLLSAADTGL